VLGVLDLLLPRRCAVCSRADTDLCGACLDALPRIQPPLCARCGAPTEWPVARCRECAGRRLAFGLARAAVEYDDAVATLVGAWKERGLRALADVAADVVAAEIAVPAADALVAVPPDPERALKRGHHPAGRLAAALGERWGLPVLPLLRRTRAGPRQRGSRLADRRRNVRGAFVAAGGAPRRVCVIDDVYTTGATAAAAASALRRAGARRVAVVTFARAVRTR
jgi:competence protein ComFC